MKQVRVTSLLALLSATVAGAAELKVTVEIPQMSVAEYHRPYVAIWAEDAAGGVAANLAVWYQIDNKGKPDKGDTWLKDLRTWWRKSGRDLEMPVDGISGASRPPGAHSMTFSGRLKSLAPGSYNLVVEAAREVGGREILRIPFDWPPKSAKAAKTQGEHEIGVVQIEVNP
jgi:hypothetical protein